MPSPTSSTANGGTGPLTYDNACRYHTRCEAQVSDLRDAVLPGAADASVLPTILPSEGVSAAA